jgi:hypothetical protein
MVLIQVPLLLDIGTPRSPLCITWSSQAAAAAALAPSYQAAALVFNEQDENGAHTDTAAA